VDLGRDQRAWPRPADSSNWEHHAGLLSGKYAHALGEDLAAAIDGKWERASNSDAPYDNIILMGHSIGAVLAD